MSKPAVAAVQSTTDESVAVPVPKATRAPKVKMYDVYVQVDGPNGPALENVDTEVSSSLPRDAAARKDAIKTATAGLSEDEQYGTFATVRTGELELLTRARKVEPQDVWS